MSDKSDAPYDHELLRDAKSKTGKSDKQIAADTGLSRATVVGVMNGNPNVTLSTLESVALAVGLTLKQLFRTKRKVSEAA